ncbi:unnamed protein product [Prunus brigantina]
MQEAFPLVSTKRRALTHPYEEGLRTRKARILHAYDNSMALPSCRVAVPTRVGGAIPPPGLWWLAQCSHKSSMSHLSWNCQGLGRALTVQKLGELIRSHAPSMVFLMETKQNCHRVSTLRRQFGYYKGFSVDPVGLAGGLALWWRPEVDVEILAFDKNMVDTIVKRSDNGILYRISWVYGPPYREDKVSFWESMANLIMANSPPWLCIGDLNEILVNDEKEGGNPWP